MTDESCVKIEIVKEIPFFGSGDTLETRLRKVGLRGFPEVKIYKNARFRDMYLSPSLIPQIFHTPQLSVYQTLLDRINSLARLFQQQGIDILDLDQAYDFVATSESGEETNWTMLPPIVERFEIPGREKGKLDYKPLIGPELRKSLEENGLDINPEAHELNHTDKLGIYSLINDGLHRVHLGLQNKGIKIIQITGMTSGFPYYAAPQPYSKVELKPVRDDKAVETKIHIVDAPGHKNLYRLFPSGGIMSGEVRSDPKLKE